MLPADGIGTQLFRESGLLHELDGLWCFLRAPATQQAIEQQVVKPALAAVAAAHRALAPYLTPEFQVRVLEFCKGVARLHRWMEEAPEYLRAAFEDTGAIPHPNLSLHDLADIIRAFHQHGKEAAVDLLNDRHEELFASDDFRRELKERWRSSRHGIVLEQILQAHDAGLYATSVPAALAQAEGIVADAVEHKGRLKLGDLLMYIDSLRGEYPLDWPAVDSFLNRFLFSNFNHGDRLPVFSRHAILHGADVSYGTRERSLLALVWVDYLLLLVADRSDRT